MSIGIAPLIVIVIGELYSQGEDQWLIPSLVSLVKLRCLATEASMVWWDLFHFILMKIALILNNCFFNSKIWMEILSTCLHRQGFASLQPGFHWHLYCRCGSFFVLWWFKTLRFFFLNNEGLGLWYQTRVKAWLTTCRAKDNQLTWYICENKGIVCSLLERH